ncbi:glucose-6-phosphate dehydrogenase, partial [bacterium]|nr:glucose-6-phosphate dehydrogenase [bacterium]
MERPQNCILVIFGASGDLTRRKLLPALFALYLKNLLPTDFAILGASRSQYTDDAFREHITKNLQEFSKSTFEPDAIHD